MALDFNVRPVFKATFIKQSLGLADQAHISQSTCIHLLFVCFFFALRPKSTAMVMGGRSVHLTTLFPGQAEQAVNQ